MIFTAAIPLLFFFFIRPSSACGQCTKKRQKDRLLLETMVHVLCIFFSLHGTDVQIQRVIEPTIIPYLKQKKCELGQGGHSGHCLLQGVEEELWVWSLGQVNISWKVEEKKKSFPFPSLEKLPWKNFSTLHVQALFWCILFSGWLSVSALVVPWVRYVATLTSRTCHATS